MKLIQCQSPPTEWYYFLNYGKKMVAKQYAWLVTDLEAANTKENRAKRPWVVLMGHRPMYCSGMFLCHFSAKTYMVFHQLADLGWVDLDLGYIPHFAQLPSHFC